MIYRPYPVLDKFAVRFLDGNPVVPATGAIVKFFKQGATVSSPVSSFSGSETVPVYQFGALGIGDVVQVGADEAKTMSIDDLDAAAGTVDVTILSGGPFGLLQGVRLVRIKKPGSPPVEDPVYIYKDPTATTTGDASRTIQTADDGWVVGYFKEYRFDVTITGSGITARVFPDAEGSWVMR